MGDAPPRQGRARRLPAFLKRRLPTSLWGRALLIIVLPVAIMQVAVTWAFFDAHWETVTARLSDGLAGDVAWVTRSVRDDPKALPAIARRAEETLQLSVALYPGRKLPTARRRPLFLALDRSLQRALDERLDDPFWFDTTRYPAFVDIRVQTAGGVLRVIAPRDRASATRGHIFVLWLAGATVLLTSVAILFIRNQVRAIERLAAAAEAFGRGAEVRDFKPYGAREVRQAASAFLDMRERILKQLEQRTTLLASVSHDLRTPLTRLKLELAMAEPSEAREAMKADLADMEHTIDEYLDFARGQANEAVEPIALEPLLRQVAENARRTGAQVTLAVEPGLTAAVRPNAFRRALANLVMNAAAHGEKIRMQAAAFERDALEIHVEDDGPGIAEDRYEEALRPFARLDESRNPNRKGVGLGLAIARDVARGHGGEITLSRSDMGGLKATIRLPK